MKKVLSVAILLIAASFNAIAGPYITTTPSVLNSFNYTIGGGPSESKVIVIESNILGPSSGNVNIVCPGDYEVSLDNMSFNTTASVPYTNDVLPQTNIYIRLKAGLALGNYNLETISFASPGASTTVSASGSVTSPCVITTGAITPTTTSFTWTSMGALVYECKVDQVSTAPTTSGTTATTTSYTASGLTPATNYYFHVRGNMGNNNFTVWTTQAFSTAPTGIINTQRNDLDIVMMPNPNNGSFTVNGKHDGIVNIEVINAIGQAVYTTTTSTDKGRFNKQIELSQTIPAGMYLLRAATKDGSSITRFTIAK